MRVFSWVLMALYILIGLLWIANSSFLFSTWGITIWLLLTVLGFIVYKLTKEKDMVRTLLLYLAVVMVFLLIIAGTIYLTTGSMPA